MSLHHNQSAPTSNPAGYLSRGLMTLIEELAAMVHASPHCDECVFLVADDTVADNRTAPNALVADGTLEDQGATPCPLMSDHTRPMPGRRGDAAHQLIPRMRRSQPGRRGLVAGKLP